jgi:biotin carboxylase
LNAILLRSVLLVYSLMVGGLTGDTICSRVEVRQAMTRILVLNRFDLSSALYSEWAPSDAEIHLVTAEACLSDATDLSGYAGVHAIERYGETAYVEYVADQLQRENSFDRIVAASEYDLLRAARLSERWKVPGRPLDETLRYRDKARMKAALDANSVPVTRWATADDPTSLLDAARTLGFPVVVKPRRGAASRGVHVLADEADLRAFLLRSPAFSGDRSADLLLEQYVTGAFYHVDGFVRDSAPMLCWPSRTTPNLALANGQPLVSTMLEPGDARLPGLVDITTRAMRALGLPEVGLFHAEVFDSPRDGLLINEIGARLGGGRIVEVLQCAFGVDPLEWYIRTLFGNVTASTQQPSLTPRVQAGYAKAAVRPGQVRSVAQRCPVPGIVGYYPEVAVGDRLAPPGSSDDHIAAWVAAATTRAAVQDALEAAVEWSNDAITIADTNGDE